ncbi:hypothetical protein Tco_0137413, partial [Tanacetum coccineum]
EDTKKIAWVKSSNTLASLDKGGFGAGSLKAFNKALLLSHLANNKDCFIRQRIVNGSWDWDWSRPITMGGTKTEFDNLILDIASLESDESVGSNSCIWNLSNDDTFSVNKVRKHIEECSLLMLSPSTRWYKMIPKKVNRLPNRLNLSSRDWDFWFDSWHASKDKKSRAYTIFAAT